ncbi:MAG: hypothetical protein NPIRA01_10330 [Nitrospirales bacterium]|nr:MAG: hypothetical protein NPIRA01_10330 [Nitrospirales bacterium]
MNRLWIFWCMVMMFAGCATSGNPSVNNEAVTKKVIAGKTTKAEVTQLLGAPNLTYESHEQGKAVEIWSYAFSSLESNPALYIPIVGLLALTSDDAIASHTKGLSVSFNEQGTVQRLARINYDSQTGGE